MPSPTMMLPAFRLAVSSPVPGHRTLVGRVLTSARFDREGEPEGFGPVWSDAAIPVTVTRWAADDYDLLALDDEVWRSFGRHGRCELRIVDDGASPAQIAESALQIAIRFQRFDVTPNPASATPFFQQILAAHEAMFDRRRPLVAADHDHALDTWRWILRLEPHASLSVQLAALFHDIERLASEADARVEGGVRDYVAFKRAHAEEGGRIVARLLASLNTPQPLVERTQALVAAHELAPDGNSVEPPVALLANADALSFFSLNAPGFARHFGPEHTARKIAYTLRRLDDTGLAWLTRLKLPRIIHSVVSETLSTESAAAPAKPAPARETPAPVVVVAPTFVAEPPV
jgi:hypothetical protein